ncbi:7290_t:CDS:1, partial [Cetraspora pellucida]
MTEQFSDPEIGSSEPKQNLNIDIAQYYLKRCLESGMKLFDKEKYYDLKGVRTAGKEIQEEIINRISERQNETFSSDEETIFGSSDDENEVIVSKIDNKSKSNYFEREKQKNNHEFRMKKLEIE